MPTGKLAVGFGDMAGAICGMQKALPEKNPFF
jgi:hypothetical protein